MISAVTLDAGDTLLYCNPTPAQIYAEGLSRHGRPVSADEVGPVFQEAWARLQRRTAPGRDRYSSVDGGERAWWGAFLDEVLGLLGHDAPAKALLDDLYAAFSRPEIWHLFPDTVPALEGLRSCGVRLAVVSNWDRRLPTILDGLGLTAWFDHVTVSSLEGVEKPAPEIFVRTAAALDVAPARMLHVGDSPREDYQGAIGAGLEARLIDRRAAFDGAPFQRIASLRELVDLVAGRDTGRPRPNGS